MKYIVATLFVAASIAALAQEDEKQYKLNPDSLAAPVRIRKAHVNLNDPLYILDEKEIPYEKLQELDPNKIESIIVLKDSTSTALYGKKGINGVVVISTKPRKKE